MTTDYSTSEALKTLCNAIPDWEVRLDELNGQIVRRQIELARLEESQNAERPPTRSVRNRGSTESLRPRDGDDNPCSSSKVYANDDLHVPDGACLDSSKAKTTPPPNHTAGAATPRPPSSSAAARRAAAPSPAGSKASSNPRPSPSALNRQSSHPTPPTQPRIGPAILRKRKTDSLVSEESLAPKYRTRSMIIVYYDSAVQTAFEELVKFVSGSRNMMRKGKMAAKMAEMRRAAELEVGPDDDDDDGFEDMLQFRRIPQGNPQTGHNEPPTADSTRLTPSTGHLYDSNNDSPVPSPSHPVAKLRFLSTRQMGPSRDSKLESPTATGQLRAGALRGYRGSIGGSEDVFDELDKALEWCQSQCEHAAHQFLRDGECEAEVENIKRKLDDVKGVAEREIERLISEVARSAVKAGRGAGGEERKGRELRAMKMRKEKDKDKEKKKERDDAAATATGKLTAANGTMNMNIDMKALEVDEMEVDDEGVGVDEMDEAPRVLVFKRAGDLFHVR